MDKCVDAAGAGDPDQRGPALRTAVEATRRIVGKSRGIRRLGRGVFGERGEQLFIFQREVELAVGVRRHSGGCGSVSCLLSHQSASLTSCRLRHDFWHDSGWPCETRRAAASRPPRPRQHYALVEREHVVPWAVQGGGVTTGASRP